MEIDVQKLLNKIIDEVHPLFTAISDEEVLRSDGESVTYTRNFLHENGKKFQVVWTVNVTEDGEVETIFHPAVTL